MIQGDSSGRYDTESGRLVGAFHDHDEPLLDDEYVASKAPPRLFFASRVDLRDNLDVMPWRPAVELFSVHVALASGLADRSDEIVCARVAERFAGIVFV